MLYLRSEAKGLPGNETVPYRLEEAGDNAPVEGGDCVRLTGDSLPRLDVSSISRASGLLPSNS
jgi:hypothetical protein